MIEKSNLATKQAAPLGRGLAALFGDADTSYKSAALVGGTAQAPATEPRTQKTLPVSWLRPGIYQPRRTFDETALNELAASIREHGVLQPLLVRAVKDAPNVYEIIAGERRWRASQIAGIHDVPVVIKELSDQDALEVALIENVQRQDLSPIEESEGYRRLMEEFQYRQEDLAKVVGKSRSHIANMLRLLTLPDSVRAMMESGRLSAGHARTLVTASDPEALAQAIVERGLSVRQAEEFTKHAAGKSPGRKVTKNETPKAGIRNADILALEKELTNQLGLRVQLNAQANGSGAVTVFYGDMDQLDSLLRLLRA